MSSIRIQDRILRVQLKLLLPVLGICSVIYIATGLLLAKNSIEDRLQISMNILESNVHSSLTFNDAKETQRSLESMRLDHALVGAKVYDANNLPIASVGSAFSLPNGSNANLEITTYELRSNQFYISKDISAQGEKLGRIEAVVAGDDLTEQLKYYTVLFLGIFGLAAFLSWILAKSTALSIAKPLVELAEFAEKIRHSGKITENLKPFQVEETFELLLLHNQFTNMLAELKERDAQISLANDTLEERVRQRTIELEAAQQSLVQSGRMSALGEMAAGIAHEINNPLTIIIGKTLQMKRCLQASPPDARKALKTNEDIAKTSMRIGNIIKGLRSFSRDGSQDPFERSDVQNILNDVIDLCATRFLNHGIDLQRAATWPSISIDCRATQIGQVLLNLLNNAHDAIEEQPEKWIRLELLEKTDSIDFIITDSGNGIPESLRAKIMDPFFTTKPVGKGTGLGLSISRGIIAAHQGKLYIDSSCPNTRFVVELPKRQIVAPELNQKAA